MGRPPTSKTTLAKLLDRSVFPAYLLDAQRRILYCNPACAAWTQLSEEQLLGARCDYHSVPEGQVLEGPVIATAISGLCPPPSAFEGQRTRITVFATRSDQSTACSADCIPLADASGDSLGCLILVDLPDEPLEVDAHAAEDSASLHRQLRAVREQFRAPYAVAELVGRSDAMQRVREQVQLALQGEPRVLVVGPPGSGREHVARTIFYGRQPDPSHDLIPLSCPLLDAELLQSTMDAFLRRCAELTGPETGTLLLLEIDQLSSDAQSVLVGLLTIAEFDLRVISTSRSPLLELAEKEQFRRDLAFALTTLEIRLPSLQERPEDLPLLIQAALEQKNAEGGRQVDGISPDALDLLSTFPWSRNVDQLFLIVGEAHRRTDGNVVELRHLPEEVHVAEQSRLHPPRNEESIRLDSFLAEIEREVITRSLLAAKGNKAEAARQLGIHRARLLRRIAQLGICDE